MTKGSLGIAGLRPDPDENPFEMNHFFDHAHVMYTVDA
jgi:hypothetical protein